MTGRFFGARGLFDFELSLQKVGTYQLFWPSNLSTNSTPLTTASERASVRVRNYGQLLAERKLFTSLGGPAENNLGRNTKSKNQLRQFGSADNVEGRKNLTSLGDWEIFRHEKVVQLWFESSKSWYVPTF